MIMRLIIYSCLFLPLFFLMTFFPEPVQFLALTFFLIASAALPQTEDFVAVSLRRFPGFLVISLVFTFLASFGIDLALFLAEANPNLSLIILVPIYFVFRLATLPWTFARDGFAGIESSYNTPPHIRWRVVAVLSAFGIISGFFPRISYFLVPAASFFVYLVLHPEKSKKLIKLGIRSRSGRSQALD
jgi:hypothetical protein